MRPHRKLILALTLLLAGGSLALTAHTGLELRSESYRLEIEQDLTEFFELPCSVAGVRGLTFSSRAFDDVAVFLPERRGEVFRCRTAIWHDILRDGVEANRLELEDGLLILGSNNWTRDDLQKVIKSGLEHDFEELHLDEVSMTDFELAFDHGDLSIRCQSAEGEIDMRSADRGIARFNAYALNGYAINEGVRIHAVFSPQNGIEVSEVTLTVPEVPLASIDIGAALQADITRGRFAGQVRYLDEDYSGNPEVFVRGNLADASLRELTQSVPFGPFEGDFSVSVYSARVCDAVVTHFHGSGSISDFALQPFAPLLKSRNLSGTASFTVDEVDLALGAINRLRLDGEVSGLSLQELLRRWGNGSATGMLAIRVNNLDIQGEKIKAADIEIASLPPVGQRGTIDRALLLGVAKNLLNFTLPAAVPERLLPQKLEYTEFGMRLLVRDNRLRILGTHGEDQNTILTVKVFGKPIGLVKEQAGSINLSPHIKRLIEQIRGYDPNRVRDWLESRKG